MFMFSSIVLALRCHKSMMACRTPGLEFKTFRKRFLVSTDVELNLRDKQFLLGVIIAYSFVLLCYNA